MYDNILIDGRNIVYRTVAASYTSIDKIHPITIFIRMMDKWRRLFKPNKWRIFWDTPKDKIWRHDIYSEYKGNRPKYEDSFKKLISDTQIYGALIFNHMNITQYIRKHNEADDLIYAYVVSHPDEKHLIISSDGDMPQIIYRHKNCDLHSPNNKKQSLIDIPEYDPVVIKALSGDKSDNIKNYPLVAEKTAIKIIKKGLEDYLSLKGRDLFDLNCTLIDFNKNPNLDDNISYINSIKDNQNFDLRKIKKIILNKSITGLYSELISHVKPFKNN